MKKTIAPGPISPSWDPEALYLKAVRYSEHMSDQSSDEWEYALWSSLSLEFLARAALSNVSPALLAECDKSWSSLYHSLGFIPTEEKFVPRSIPISEVFKRLTLILPAFTKEHEGFGILHTGRRNAELHSGLAAFDGVKGSAWQPRFYETCEILLISMGITLREFFGEDDEQVARKLIAAAADDSAKAVKGETEAHKRVWMGKTNEERTTLSEQALVWATRHLGHRVACPACGSQAIVVGEPVSAPARKLKDDAITETQEYLPSQFQCVACGLKIAGLSRLTAVGLGDRYKKTQTYDLADQYAPEDDYDGYEDDNNEP